MFETLKRAPAYRVAEEAIRRRILDGSLAPGDLLPTEHDLARQLAVTRPTVREALRGLENAGLVERGARRRMVVTAPSPRVVRDAMHQAIVLHGMTYRELWEVGLALEPAAAELAAARVTPELLEQLKANLARTRASLSDPAQLAAADLEFHELVVRASGNRVMVVAREQMGEFMAPERLTGAYRAVLRSAEPGKRLLATHRRIFAALEAGDARAARERMASHFREFRRASERAGIDYDAPVGQRPS